LKTPKKIGLPGGGCKWQPSEESYRPQDEFNIPTEIFEKGKNIYIAPKYYYEMTQEIRQEGRSKFKACEKMQNSLETVESGQPYNATGWKIMVETAENDTELEQIIKDYHGRGCLLGEQVVSDQEGVFDVKIKLPVEEGEDFDLETLTEKKNVS